MRQIGTDFFFDPYQAVTTAGFPTTSTPPDHKNWAKDTVITK